MQVKSIAECSKRSILQYFRISLSYHLSLRSVFCLFLSGRLRHILLYCKLSYFLTPGVYVFGYFQATDAQGVAVSSLNIQRLKQFF